jgi:hypothetical protein
VVRDGAEQGQFTVDDQRPRDVAAQILAGVQGALLVGRLTSDRHVLGVVAEGTRRYLGYAPKSTMKILGASNMRGRSLAQELRQLGDIRCNPSRLIPAEQLGGQALACILVPESLALLTIRASAACAGSAASAAPAACAASAASVDCAAAASVAARLLGKL